MLISGRRAFTHNNPTTYKRITPERGCGFILKRIYDLTENPKMPRGSYAAHPTKEDVYLGTPWYHRPGFASLLWSSLLEDGLIASDNGMEEYDGNLSRFSSRSKRYARAYGHYEFGRGWTVRYHLTDKGRGILYDMMARVNKVREEKKAFCERNGIEFGTGRVLNTVGSVAEFDAKKDEEVTPPPTPIERDILEKEALDCAKLAADYAGENQKLRAEKDDLNARLKKLANRMSWLEDELVSTKNELENLIDWNK